MNWIGLVKLDVGLDELDWIGLVFGCWIYWINIICIICIIWGIPWRAKNPTTFLTFVYLKILYLLFYVDTELY